MPEHAAALSPACRGTAEAKPERKASSTLRWDAWLVESAGDSFRLRTWISAISPACCGTAEAKPNVMRAARTAGALPRRPRCGADTRANATVMRRARRRRNLT
jgi:hypothetical protein